MPRITVRPEQLRSLSAQLQQIADDLHGVSGRMGSAISNLDWEARQKAGVDGQVNDARNRANTLADHALAMSRYLASKAEAFEEADGAGVQAFEDIKMTLPSAGFLPFMLPQFRLPWPFSSVPWTRLPVLGLPVSIGALIAGALVPDWLEDWVKQRWPGARRTTPPVQQQEKATPPTPPPSHAPAPQTWTEEQILGKIAGSHGRLPKETGQQCVDWAQDRRESLEGTSLPAISTYSPKDWGAHNYIRIFGDSAVQIGSGDVSEAGVSVAGLQPGAAIVWDKGHAGLRGTDGYTYGHVAVVEAVQADGVWVSQANWPGKPVMFIPNEKMPGLYVVPPDAKPISPEDF